MEREPRPGALRFRNDSGEWIAANPGDALFSTVTMCASEFYTEQGWRPIFEDDDKVTPNNEGA